MPVPDLKGDFNSVSGLLTSLLMWVFGLDKQDGQGGGFLDMLKNFFSRTSAQTSTATPPSTQTTAVQPSTPPAAGAAPGTATTATSGPPPAAATGDVVFWGDSIMQGAAKAKIGEHFKHVADMGVTSASLEGNIKPMDVNKIPAGSTVFLSALIANGAGFLVKASDDRIKAHCDSIVAAAENIKNKGGQVFIVGMDVPKEKISIMDHGQSRLQSDQEFKDWQDTIVRLNTAQKKAAEDAGFKFIVPSEGVHLANNVHYKEYDTVANNLAKQAGVTLS